MLLTGANGFLGRSIERHFSEKNKNITVRTAGRSNTCDYTFDLTNGSFRFNEHFDVVVHAAGKAHFVPKKTEEVASFFAVNYQGTVNLLAALENNLPASFVFISSVSVYGVSKGLNIPEDTVLAAKDPYGKSKIMAEHYISEWCGKRNIHCVIFRLPLLIGKNAPGNLAAMIKGIKKGYYFNIGNGGAKKSMVMVNDIPVAIEAAIGKTGIFNLTDGVNPSFYELSKLIAKQIGKKNVYSIPKWIAFLLSMMGNLFGTISPINTSKFDKITADLTFNNAKARKELNWRPSSVLDHFRL